MIRSLKRLLPLCLLPLLVSGCALGALFTTSAGQATLGAGGAAGAGVAIAAAIQTDLPLDYKIACSLISVADGDFKALAPALLAKGKLTQSQIDKEAGVFAVDQARCANPPTDLIGAQAALIADGVGIFSLLALPPPAAPKQ